MFSKHVLLGASALIAVTSLSATAQADDLFGGGASLPAPYHRQAADCYGVKTDLLIRQKDANGDVIAPETLTVPDFDNGTDNCGTLSPVDANLTVHYTSTGSGTGIDGYVSNDPTQYGPSDPDDVAPFDEYYDDVDYAISEAPITLSDLDSTDFETTMGGPVVQVPMLIAPVAIAYDPVYRDANGVEHSFNIATVDGKLHLSRDNYCKIFTGEITDWSDIAFQAANNGQLLASSPVAIEVVARSDSSGTSNLFTRHMAKVCGDTSTGGVFPEDGTKKYPQMIAAYNEDKDPADQITNTIFADQNFGVATAINYSFNVPDVDDTPVNTARIGYAGADHVEQWAARTGANDYALDAAVLENHDGSFVALSPAAATDAFTGAYTLPSGAALSNPDAWVGIDTQAHRDTLYDPTGASSYPIIGTSNILAYTCYDNDHNEVAKLKNYLNWYFDSSKLPSTGTGGADGILSYAGLAPVPSNLQSLITNVFLNSNSPFRIRNATACSGYTGG